MEPVSEAPDLVQNKVTAYPLYHPLHHLPFNPETIICLLLGARSALLLFLLLLLLLLLLFLFLLLAEHNAAMGATDQAEGE